MRTTANGIQINYTIDGEGPWVVMSHSLACSLEMWDPQIEALKAGYKVLRFDTRGHGRSDAPAGAYTLEQMADDVHGLLQALKVERPALRRAVHGRHDRHDVCAEVSGPVPQPGVVRYVEPARTGGAAGLGRSHQDRHARRAWNRWWSRRSSAGSPRPW